VQGHALADGRDRAKGLRRHREPVPDAVDVDDDVV
jgi:hypothetical protein